MKPNSIIKLLSSCALMLCMFLTDTCFAQGLPELMYFRFNTVTAGVTPNDAPIGTRVCPSATVNGNLTIGGTGQFAGGLNGTAGSSTANFLNTNWTLNVPGDWTISFWFKPSAIPDYRSFFGSTGIGCYFFTGKLRFATVGGTNPTTTAGVAVNTPWVIHWVHNDAANTISGYVNGVLDVTVTAASAPLTGAGNFQLGAYPNGATNALEGVMDEFRMYNRALSQTEITNTWNIDLFAAQCAPPTNLTASGITSNSANIAWTPVAGSAGYEYVVSQSATAPTGSGTPVATAYTTIIGLTSSTTYYVHVRNICNPASSSAWATQSFTTSVNTCAYPTNITYNAPTASSANFTWSPVAGSGGYEYAVTPTSTHPTSGITATNATSGSATGLTGGNTYYLHVRNRCVPSGMSDWATMVFTMPECKKPGNILFSHITDNSASIQWSMMPAANVYEYVVDNSAGDPPIASGATSTTSNTAQVNGLIPNTKYYVHIRSLCFINDVSEWALDSFITHFNCAAPAVTVLNPGTSTPTASWSPITEAQSYEYLMSSSSVPPPFGTETLSTSQSFALPADGKNYYVHVRAKCFSQFTFSTWSTATLRDMGTGVQEIGNDAALIVAYPNPVKDKIIVDIANPSAEATVSILDMTGKVLQYVATPGSRFEADMSKFAKGVYLLKYNDGERSQTIRVSKL